MNTDFPESLFLPVKRESVELGKDIAKDKRIFFCGIARNVEKTLKPNIERLERTAGPFLDHKIFIYENDSSDNTANILKNDSRVISVHEHRKNENYWEDINTGKAHNHYHRCKELAECRNRYIQGVHETHCESYDYMCVLDLDLYGWSYSGFYESLTWLEAPNCASVSSYGVLSDYENKLTLETSSGFLMYDSFAFRPFGYNDMLPPNHQVQFNSIQPNIDKPIQVRCNFGGLAIYKMKYAAQSTYKTKLSNNLVDSEHVHFYDKISGFGKVHLFNQKMVTSYSKHKFVEV